jgi:hypothetical protein
MWHKLTVDRVTLAPLGGNGRIAGVVQTGSDNIETRENNGEWPLWQTKFMANGKSINDERCWKSTKTARRQYNRHDG